MLLNNGQTVIVGSDRDVLEVIGENFSYELAEYIDQILWNQEALDKYMRDIEKAIKNGDKQAQLTKDIFINRIVRYIGAYMTEMGGLDVLVFTAGIGEHDASVRKQIMDGLTWLGLEYDEEANKANHEGVITTPNSKITAMIVPTNEELMIARDVVRLAKLDKLNK